MNDDFYKVREILRQLGDMMENMWIERESMRLVLTNIYGAPPETIEESLKFARESPEMRANAQQVFAQMRKALEVESIDILVQEMMSKLPDTGKPN